MHYFRQAMYVAVAVVFMMAPGALQAQVTSAQAGNISDILRYINNAWQVLTRAMDDCKTVAEEKFRAQSMMYVPADIPMPEKAREVGQRCNVRVEPLPEVIKKIGTIDLTKIRQPGLLYLPNPYVVPGGMFNEMYGWDSYFIIRGLVEDGKTDLARGMVENFFYEIDHYGAVLNGAFDYRKYLDALSADEWRAMSLDLQRAHSAIMRTVKADHVNVESLGNIVPHLHWHIVPRYRDDPRWGLPVWMNSLEEMADTRLSTAERDALIENLRRAIEAAAI